MITGRHRFPGCSCTDHVLELPVDHGQPGGARLEVFAREVVRAGRESDDLPWLLYLQGGPGHKADRPAPGHGWLHRALEEFRVLLLDQRGTGRSTPLSRLTVPRCGPPADQAEYLSHFRADQIVWDAEAFRVALAGAGTSWSVLGQSYGGFCATTYLSQAPEHLCEVFIAGGLPSLTATADEIYRAAYPRVRAKNEAFFARYPGDAPLLRRIVDHLHTRDVRLPSAERLTPRRLQLVGIELGMAAQFDTLHYLFEEAFVSDRQLSDTFLRGVDAVVSYATQPLFAVLHELIYCQGTASRWAAERTRSEFPEFNADVDQPVLLTGEMIYSWVFTEDPALRDLREASDLLADRNAWPHLYDARRLAENAVPVAAAIYHDDMFVDQQMSMRTAEAVRGIRAWVTNEYEHDGLRVGNVLDRLIKMARGLV